MTEIIHESALVVGVAAAIAICAAIAAVIALLPAEIRDGAPHR
jgi:hypothetical protein